MIPWFAKSEEQGNYRDLRLRMVEEQLAKRGIKDPVILEAMKSVPRHLFISPEQRSLAYEDGPVGIGQDQTISQPYIVAYMLELLNLSGAERVLEIGTGSGYVTALLDELTQEVYTVEIVRELLEQAKYILLELGYRNIHFKLGDGYEGWPEHAPFDRIIANACADRVPEPLLAQLKEGGILVIPIGKQTEQRLMVYRKTEQGKIVSESRGSVAFVPMTGQAEIQ